LAEAAANAAREGNIAPADIAALVISRPGWTKLPGPLHPDDLISMAHSPAFFVAAGAHDKRFGWEHAGAEKIAERSIHALIGKVRVGPQPADATGYRQGATVTIETTDGRKVTNTVKIPKGAASLGVDWADIDEKYRALVPNAPMSKENIETSLASIKELKSARGVSELVGQLG